MATLKREKTAIIFNIFSSNFILVVLANLFSSHRSRVELLGTVLAHFHFNVWPYKSGLKWVEPYKWESGHYGNGVWEGGGSLTKRRRVKVINHILERSSPFPLVRRRWRSSLVSCQKDRDIWFVWAPDSLASVPVSPSLCMIEQMSQSLVNGWQSNRDVLQLKSVGLGAGPPEIAKFNQYRSKGSTFFFFFF